MTLNMMLKLLHSMTPIHVCQAQGVSITAMSELYRVYAISVVNQDHRCVWQAALSLHMPPARVTLNQVIIVTLNENHQLCFDAVSLSVVQP